jgi:hypothetical protein
MATRGSEVVEQLIAKKLSSFKGEPFSVADLEPYVRKMQSFDIEQRAEEEKLKQQVLDGRRREKPPMVCTNSECRNSREEMFENDDRLGQITCMVCGTVAVERLIVDKEWVRNFEDDEEDKSFHGRPPDPNFSSARNLSITFARAPGTSKASATEKRRLQEEIELNTSKSSDQRTRTGYRDHQKMAMFDKMSEVRDALQLHDTVLERAKQIFARYRDKEEQITKPYEHVAACMLVAYREKVASDKGSGAKDAPVRQLYKCKYCGDEFALERDRWLHQKECDKRPKRSDAKEPSEQAHQDDDGGQQNKRMRLG